MPGLKVGCWLFCFGHLIVPLFQLFFQPLGNLFGNFATHFQMYSVVSSFDALRLHFTRGQPAVPFVSDSGLVQ